MENKSYYPLRVGRFPNCIVTDTPTSFNGQPPDPKDVQHYGGYLVAESAPAEIARQMVEAYNYVYGCTSNKDKACTGGCMCCQAKGMAFSKGIPEGNIWHENSAHSFTEGHDPHTTDENIGKTVAEVYRKPSIDEQIEWLADLNKKLTNDYDITKKDFDNIRDISENLQAIKRWREGPVMKDIDCEKVIKDLLEFSHYAVKNLDKSNLEEYDFPKLHDNLMNAEAALGILQALKEKRDIPTIKPGEYNIFVGKPRTKTLGNVGSDLQSTGQSLNIPPLVDGKLQKIEGEHLCATCDQRFSGSKITDIDNGRIYCSQKCVADYHFENTNPYAADEIGLTFQRQKRYLIPAEKHKEIVKGIVDKLHFFPEINESIASVTLYAIEQYLTYLNQPPDGKP